MRFLAILWRLIVLAVSLMASVAVATIVGIYALRPLLDTVGGNLAMIAPEDLPRLASDLGTTLLSILSVMIAAFVPWVIFIVITELMRLRGLIVHLAGGAVVAICAGALTGLGLRPEVMQVAVALGVVGGFVHWLIAGRNAGKWQDGTLRPDVAPASVPEIHPGDNTRPGRRPSALPPTVPPAS